MITLSRRETIVASSHDMTRAELESEWRNARVSFEQALAAKTEADRVYVAAATRLNTLDRLVKQVEQRAAAAKRAAVKALIQIG
ncbi:MAG TPA: hypothetical protein VF952_03780 [Chloroflexia bacterium]|jgi:hypothetical protein